jgi:hypothetical protein
MVEAIIGFLAVVFLLWVFYTETSNANSTPKYSIKRTEDKRFCEVINNSTKQTEFVGTRAQCDKYIAEQGKK